MKVIKHLLIVAVAITTFGLSSTSAQAQGFNREDMMKRFMSSYRERLGVKDDDEWSIISERLTKVMEIRMSGFGGRGRPGGEW